MSTGRAQWLKPYHFTGNDDSRNWRKGRGKSLTTLIKEALNKNVLCGSPIPNGMEAAEFLAEAMVGHAIKGHPTCISEVMARMEGKIGVESEAPQTLDTRPVIYIPDNGRGPNASGNLSSERSANGDTVLRGAHSSTAQHEANPASPNGHCQNGQNGKGDQDPGTSFDGLEAND